MVPHFLEEVPQCRDFAIQGGSMDVVGHYRWDGFAPHNRAKDVVSLQSLIRLKGHIQNRYH